MTWSSSTRYSFYNKLKMDAFYLVLVFEYTFLVSNCVTTCLTYNYILYTSSGLRSHNIWERQTTSLSQNVLDVR